MRQVLFYIPLQSWFGVFTDIPIFGYGAMLFLAFVFCTLLAARLARREAIPGAVLQDLAIWIFLAGILGARITFMIQYQHRFYSLFSNPLGWLLQFIQLWDGGLVFYGSAIGGTIGYFLAYFTWLRKYHLSSWKMADVIAPCAALGLALGRVGCLLNGCCYGEVACAECPAVHFPMSAAPLYTMVERGYQTAAGFVYDPVKRQVTAVAPASPAEEAGLKVGDTIVGVNGNLLAVGYDRLVSALRDQWPRGKTDLELTVQRGHETIALPAFRPTTIGLHPTQIYETISMLLLVFFLLAYYPFKCHDGSVMVLFMLGYGVHRFLNEMLRTDTDPVAFGMTLSQNISILVIAAGVVLGLIVLSKGPGGPVGTTATSPATASETQPGSGTSLDGTTHP